MSNATEPAYPVNSSSYPARDGDYTVHETAGGLTKRELIAAMAMQGLCAGESQQMQIHTPEGVLIVPARKAIPMLAVQYADALLSELERRDD